MSNSEKNLNVFLLEARNIIKYYGEILALNNVNFCIKQGHFHALVGSNGSGKSTLVRILAGLEKSDSGIVLWRGNDISAYHLKERMKLGIAFIWQNSQMLPNLSVVENLFIGQEDNNHMKYIIEQKTEQIHTKKILKQLRLNIDPSTLVSHLSDSQRQLCQIARALIKKNKLIVVDEATTALDKKEVNVFLDIIGDLKKEGVSFLFITHKLSEIEKIVDEISVLEFGRKKKALKSAKLIKEYIDDDKIKYKYSTNPKTAIIISADSLCAGRLKKASFYAKVGEILGLCGESGSGRLELLKIIYGARASSKGTMVLKGKVFIPRNPGDAIASGISILFENAIKENLIASQNALENVTLPILQIFCNKFHLLREAYRHSYTKQTLMNFNVNPNDPNKIISTFSGGNQQKIAVCKCATSASCIAIFDEPTKGLDKKSKIEFYSLIKNLSQRDITVIWASSEIKEIQNLCDRIYKIENGILFQWR